MKKITLIVACLIAQASFAASENKNFDSKGLSEVSVENTSGKVSISSSEGPSATVAVTKNKFSDKCKMTVDRAGNKLVLKVKQSSTLFSSEACDVDFEVKVPKTVDLDLAMGSGPLTIHDIQGSLSFKVGSGDVSAEGSFKKIDGKSGSGKVRVQGLTGGGELKTGSGNMDLNFATSPSTGELDLKTGSGNATIRFPKGSHVKTNFIAGSGQVSNELGDNLKASFVVSMKAGSGNLKIKSY